MEQIEALAEQLEDQACNGVVVLEDLKAIAEATEGETHESLWLITELTTQGYIIESEAEGLTISAEDESPYALYKALMHIEMYASK